MILEEPSEEGKDISVHIYEDTNHAMRLLNLSGEPPRWPGRPVDFYERQTAFILNAVN